MGDLIGGRKSARGQRCAGGDCTNEVMREITELDKSI